MLTFIVAQLKMEWWLNHIGQMAQSDQDYSLMVIFLNTLQN